MFSFHKPKVYRSPSGCCICKAKSSRYVAPKSRGSDVSRFTDSRKYEEDFVDCFQLDEPRSGEVCNACVLLVKRWKKLPTGNQRNWRHVVDARAGPGTKSLLKIKAKKNLKYKIKSKRHVEEEDERSNKLHLGNHEQEESEQISNPPSPSRSPVEDESSELCRRSKKRIISPPVSSFLDMTYWKEEKVCCGVIFKGAHNEIIIDPRRMTPCRSRLATAAVGAPPVPPPLPSALPVPPATPSTTKADIDNSSDSGYDESSNPGEVPPNPAHN